MKNRYILAIDPSGNFIEGKGITGWVLLDTKTDKVIKFGYISASMYPNQFKYWDAHVTLLDSMAGYYPSVVIEEYRLYNNRAEQQINSILETPRLIGVLTYECYKRGYWCTTQSAVSVKTRWSDDLLVRKHYLWEENGNYKIGKTIVSDHVRDALRHAVHFKTFRNRRDDWYEGPKENEFGRFN